MAPVFSLGEGNMEYEIIRSDRKTLALQLKEDGTLLVRAPRSAAYLAAIKS